MGTLKAASNIYILWKGDLAAAGKENPDGRESMTPYGIRAWTIGNRVAALFFFSLWLKLLKGIVYIITALKNLKK